jgi:hypothetical protein
MRLSPVYYSRKPERDSDFLPASEGSTLAISLIQISARDAD